MKPQPQLLIVDDDAEITSLLADYLARFNFKAHTAGDGVQMWAELARHPIDLVVLDVMLPGVDGLQLSREIRQRSTIPVILLTARRGIYDRIMGLENGADDYVSKPFEPRELVARIHTVLRRAKPTLDSAAALLYSDVVHFDGWVLHRSERSLTSPSGLTVALSNAEFRLLSTFLQTPRRLFSRDQLVEQARGRTMDVFERSIDLLVSRLRQKLAQDPQAPSMIKTVRGAGYMFNAQSVQGRSAWHN
ncbi:response regulator [Rhodoferax fermentans]|uniref:DNA-binding response regulator n=1 Tax=Rhodoferax fermentans TaxID=28066 RepID=A0A1T1APR8_RHOFE|nr:response regulator transcription factor [Rhodoferax fermentans]MBK1682621.1 DNA-binding response regulator [Rhodoferax fermentans]OOV06005.1 DNA-binding response regulator [Rhodoferax fermentans]